jgi:hypothetical protein
MPRRLLVLTFALSTLAACSSPDPVGDGGVPVRTATVPAGFSVPADEFGDYWYQGLAEITSYDLEQARYGEVHPGEAVLIYVTEPFLQGEQVKADDPDADGAVTVLKLNATRTFLTGVYPYSMMTSVFTPVQRAEHGPTLKVTATSQEWCGHTFTQLNRTADGYRMRLFSYFESEGDQDRTLGGALLEDGLWTTLRLNPDALPTGDVRLVPGTVYQRLSHLDLEPHAATATLAADPETPGLGRYTLTYPDLDRTLTIRFSADFPHTIEGWTETRRSGPGAEILTTTATRRARDLMAYWSLNGRADVGLREALGLDG